MAASPPSPDLSFEKKQAKALLKACRAGDAAALARVRAHLPRKAAGGLRLADAQHVIARERGFPSWPKLKAHVESARPLAERAERLLAAVREGRSAVVERLLRSHPQLARFDIFTASAAGDAGAVAGFLAEDPARAVATHGEEEWPPLAYACASRRHRASERRARELRRVATLLLEAGASSNSHSVYHEEGGWKAPISVLYHACMSDHVALAELLLERGARTDDGESVYHAAQLDRRACLELLLAHGADLSSAQQPYGNTPLYFLVGHQDDGGGTTPWFRGLVWLLEHGADPNVPSGKSAETPLHGLAADGPKVATARQLLAHGADPDLPRADGRTPYAIAVRNGNSPVADVLLAAGARTDVLEPMDLFLGACLEADGARARAALAAHAGLFEAMDERDRGAIVRAAWHGRADAVRLMLDLGFRLDATDADGATGLHAAAWTGSPDVVKLLLSLGAPVNVRERRFGGSPLGWAAHGSRFGPGTAGAYRVIVDALLDAGADRETAINSGGVPPEALASRAVAAQLVARGFAPGKGAGG